MLVRLCIGPGSFSHNATRSSPLNAPCTAHYQAPPGRPSSPHNRFHADPPWLAPPPPLGRRPTFPSGAPRPGRLKQGGVRNLLLVSGSPCNLIVGPREFFRGADSVFASLPRASWLGAVTAGARGVDFLPVADKKSYLVKRPHASALGFHRVGGGGRARFSLALPRGIVGHPAILRVPTALHRALRFL